MTMSDSTPVQRSLASAADAHDTVNLTDLLTVQDAARSNVTVSWVYEHVGGTRRTTCRS